MSFWTTALILILCASMCFYLGFRMGQVSQELLNDDDPETDFSEDE